MERLRSRKAAVNEQIDDRRAATRFEPQIENTTGQEKTLDQVLQDVQGAALSDNPAKPPAQTSMAPGQADEDSYTARLLKAKQKARRDEEGKKG